MVGRRKAEEKAGVSRAPRLLPGRRTLSLTALLFVIVLLLLFNLFAWRMLRYLWNSKERDLEIRLRYVAQAIARELARPPSLIFDFIGNQDEQETSELLYSFYGTQTFVSLQQQLSSLKDLNELSDVVLMTPSGIVIADANGTALPGDVYVYRDLDRDQLQRAVAGQPAAFQLYSVGKEMYKRVYVPLRVDSELLGILQVSASADYVAEMVRLRGRVFMNSLLTSILLVVLAVSIFRLFHYLVRAERLATQAARVEAMGSLAAGVAHELRNPLSIIRVLADEISYESKEGTQSRENAAEIAAEVERLNGIISHFLSLSGAPELSLSERVDLGEELQRVVHLMRKSAPETLQLRTAIHADGVVVRADQRALRQLFLNLLLNARDAIGETAGTIEVELNRERDTAQVLIRDTGPGFPDKDISRVFEPFYTTKKAGTGLGLAISRSIVQNLGGEIILRNRPGSGAEVQVQLPLAEQGLP